MALASGFSVGFCFVLEDTITVSTFGGLDGGQGAVDSRRARIGREREAISIMKIIFIYNKAAGRYIVNENRYQEGLRPRKEP
jgi:hypothetical protein